jgi:phosphonatase-like hydrolase
MVPELVCLDMAGTTVADNGLVTAAFEAALVAIGISAGSPERGLLLEYMRQTMGQSKIEVFRDLFPEPEVAEKANEVFERTYASLITAGGAAPIPGAPQVLAALRAAGTRVVLTTGFAPSTRDQILSSLGWAGLVDGVLSPADVGRGRPFPDMILVAALNLQVTDLGAVVVVGDTVSDMESGRRAGVGRVVGVRSGADPEDELAEAGATDIIDSVANLPDLLSGRLGVGDGRPPGPRRDPVFRHVEDVAWQPVKAIRLADGSTASVWERWLAFSTDPPYLSLLGRYDPGMIVRRHGHRSPHVFIVLDGEIQVGEEACGPGSHVELPLGAAIGPLVAGPEGAVLFEVMCGDPRSWGDKPALFEQALAAVGAEPLPDPPLELPGALDDERGVWAGGGTAPSPDVPAG